VQIHQRHKDEGRRKVEGREERRRERTGSREGQKEGGTNYRKGFPES
jgi:hypothetical protein